MYGKKDVILHDMEHKVLYDVDFQHRLTQAKKFLLETGCPEREIIPHMASVAIVLHLSDVGLLDETEE
jgi:hypothetical protein